MEKSVDIFGIAKSPEVRSAVDRFASQRQLQARILADPSWPRTMVDTDSKNHCFNLDDALDSAIYLDDDDGDDGVIYLDSGN